MNTPLVSIIIPCYNAAQFLEETLQSVLDMNYTAWECIIVNDGSTDNSQSVIATYVQQDSRFRCIEQSNAGPSKARNTGIQSSNGIYILPLDSDDLISKKYVSEAVTILENTPSIKLVYSNAEYFGKKHGKWDLPAYSFNDLLFENMIFCTAMYRRIDYNMTRGYDTKLHGREDWDFWLELLKTGGDVYKIDDVHFFYRTHEESRDRRANRDLAAIRKHIYLNHKELYEHCFENPIQLFHEHAFFKKKYNILRKITLRKPIT